MPKSKLGPAFKWGEETVPVTVRIPKSVYNEIPEPKRDSITREVIKKYKKKNKKNVTEGKRADFGVRRMNKKKTKTQKNKQRMNDKFYFIFSFNN